MATRFGGRLGRLALARAGHCGSARTVGRLTCWSSFASARPPVGSVARPLGSSGLHRGRTNMLVNGVSNIQYLGSREHDDLCWVSNTLLDTLTPTQMLDIAESAHRCRPRTESAAGGPRVGRDRGVSRLARSPRRSRAPGPRSRALRRRCSRGSRRWWSSSRTRFEPRLRLGSARSLSSPRGPPMR